MTSAHVDQFARQQAKQKVARHGTNVFGMTFPSEWEAEDFWFEFIRDLYITYLTVGEEVD